MQQLFFKWYISKRKACYNMDSEFLSVKEVAVIFAVTEVTIRRAIHKGWIAAIRVGEGKHSSYRVSKKCLDAIHQSLLKQMAEKAKKQG
jgi:excisionase family DNA binding protein